MTDRTPAWTDGPDDPPELRRAPATSPSGSEPLSNGSGRAAAAPTETRGPRVDPALAGVLAMAQAMDLEALVPLLRPMLAQVTLDGKSTLKMVDLVERLGFDGWARRRIAFALLESSVVELGHFTPLGLEAYVQVPSSMRGEVGDAEGWLRVVPERPSPATSPASPRVS